MPDPTEIAGAVAQTAAAPAFWWVSPTITFVTACGAIAVAVTAIVANRATARLRATLDHIERTESQPYYKELSETFKKIRKEKLFMSLVDPKEEDFKTASSLLFFLNHYELIAVGFKHRVLDKKVYSLFMRDTVVRDWNESKEFIAALRNLSGETISDLFTEFQAVAEEWQAEIDFERAKHPPKKISMHRYARRAVDSFAGNVGRARYAVLYVIVVFRRVRRWPHST